MWLFELLGFSFIIGAIMGLVWRIGEDWLERREMRKQLEAELLIGGEEEDIGGVAIVQPINVSVPVVTPTTKSN